MSFPGFTFLAFTAANVESFSAWRLRRVTLRLRLLDPFEAPCPHCGDQSTYPKTAIKVLQAHLATRFTENPKESRSHVQTHLFRCSFSATKPRPAYTHFEGASAGPNGPVCPHCGNARKRPSTAPLTGKSNRPGLIHCNACWELLFTVKIGTASWKAAISPLTQLADRHGLLPVCVPARRAFQRKPASSPAWHYLQIGMVHGPPHPRS